MDKIKVQEFADKGLTVQKIADEFGINRSKMKYFIRKNKIKIKNTKKLIKPITKEILLELIELDISTYKMAAKLGCSNSTIRHWLKKYNLKRSIKRFKLQNSKGEIDSIESNNDHKRCPKCELLLKVNKENFYISKNKIHVWCVKCNDQATKDRQRKRKLECLEYKGGKCIICGYNKYQGALEFHHIDPSQKTNEIGVLKNFSLEKLKPELDKCVILCANCHKEFHGGLIKLPENTK